MEGRFGERDVEANPFETARRPRFWRVGGRSAVGSSTGEAADGGIGDEGLSPRWAGTLERISGLSDPFRAGDLKRKTPPPKGDASYRAGTPRKTLVGESPNAVPRSLPGVPIPIKKACDISGETGAVWVFSNTVWKARLTNLPNQMIKDKVSSFLLPDLKKLTLILTHLDPPILLPPEP